MNKFNSKFRIELYFKKKINESMMKYAIGKKKHEIKQKIYISIGPQQVN